MALLHLEPARAGYGPTALEPARAGYAEEDSNAG